MDQARALLDVQSADLELLRLEKRLDELPEKRAILEVRAKAREVAELKSKAELLVRKLESELKAHQDEISTVTDKLSEEQARLMATSDHRQVQSLSRDMDGLKRRKDKLEMESLQLMERIEKARGQVAKVDEAIAQLELREQALVERFKAVGAGIQSEIARVTAERSAAAGGLDADLLARYEAVREAKGGVGVGRLDAQTCTACHMALPAERVAELQAGPDVGLCPQCRRLLVVRLGDSES